ncbi:hypothetical protein DSM104299_00645 [Baekduia alba]|nr:hypothetical protein DSM104299_00645 [Baekduia alba]
MSGCHPALDVRADTAHTHSMAPRRAANFLSAIVALAACAAPARA